MPGRLKALSSTPSTTRGNGKRELKGGNVCKLKDSLFKIYCAYVDVCVAGVHLVPPEARKGYWIPKTGIINDYEPPCGC